MERNRCGSSLPETRLLSALLALLSVSLGACGGSPGADSGPGGSPAAVSSTRATFEDGSFPDTTPAAFCLDFSDTGAGSTWAVGTTLLSNGRRVALVAPQVSTVGTPPPGGGGTGAAEVQPNADAGGTAPELFTGTTLAKPDLDGQARFLELHVSERGGWHQIEINGKAVSFPNAVLQRLAEVKVQHQGNVIYTYVPSPSDSRRGILRARGFIDEFAIGGQELSIDDVCVWRDDCGPVASELVESPFSTTFPQSTPVPFDGTRGIAAAVLGSKDRQLVTVRLLDVHVPAGSSATIGARLYEDGTGQLVAKDEAVVAGSSAPQEVTIPLHAPLRAGVTYVFAVYGSAAAGSTAGAPALGIVTMGGWPYHESEAVMLVHGGRKEPSDVYPPTTANEFPRLVIVTTCP